MSCSSFYRKFSDGGHFFLTLILRIILDLIILAFSIPIYIGYCFSGNSGIRNKYESIFITGASSGIGKQLAIALAGKGVTLFLQGRNEERLRKVVSICNAKTSGDGKVRHYVCDVRDTKSLQFCVLDADDYRPLDLIIANAGVGTLNCPGSKDFYNILSHNLQINIVGTINTILPIISRFQTREKGHIAIVSSVASYMNPPNSLSPYPATKVFLRYICEILRWSLRKYNINVTCINPGYVRTPMIEGYKGKIQYKCSVKSSTAAQIIMDGLKRNLSEIYFPGSQWFLTYYFGSLHPFIKELLNYNLFDDNTINNRFPINSNINKSCNIYYENNINNNNITNSSLGVIDQSTSDIGLTVKNGIASTHNDKNKYNINNNNNKNNNRNIENDEIIKTTNDTIDDLLIDESDSNSNDDKKSYSNNSNNNNNNNNNNNISININDKQEENKQNTPEQETEDKPLLS